VEPIAEVPLQHHGPPDRVKNTKSGHLVLVIATTKVLKRGVIATVAVGIHLTLIASKKHRMRSLATSSIALYIMDPFKKSPSGWRAVMPSILEPPPYNQAR
jgi:hypothetical protein